MSAIAADGKGLRVGLLTRFYPPRLGSGGIGRYVWELAHALHAGGHEVHVLTESAEQLRRDGSRLFVHGVRARAEAPVAPGLPLTDHNLRWSLSLLDRVLELSREHGPLDVVESPTWGSEGVALLRSGLVPVVVRVHTPLPVVAEHEGWGRSPDVLAAGALERWLIEAAHGVVWSTDGVAAVVRDTLGVDCRRHARSARIPLGIDPGPAPRPPTFAGGPRLLFVGRLERRKGIHTLLDVLPDLLREEPRLEVDLVGDDRIPGPDGQTPRDAFERRHRGASWMRRCRFHGHVDEPACQAFYRRCTVFVAPSLSESFGLIYLEAMRHGKPGIGCRAGGIPEVVRDGETGLLVPPGDAPALGAALRRLLHDAALRTRLGESGRRSVEREFSAARMAAESEAFYRRVLAEVGDGSSRRSA